ncbi:MAG: hypothetical protein NTX03_12700 [Bacteroidetes bacterium]|nr:hypothetical protein [Bacteroidota bacterium]
MYRLLVYLFFFYLIYTFFKNVIAPIFRGYNRQQNNPPNAYQDQSPQTEKPKDKKDDDGEYIDYTEVK